MSTEQPTVYAAFSAAMEEVQAVRKEGFNKSQSYNFRGIDQVVNAVGPIFRKHKIIPIPHKTVSGYRDVMTSTGKPSREVTVTVTYRFYGPAGDHIEAEVPGESMDTGDKGAAKAMSVAYRILLLQSLIIPTDDRDPDQDSYERAVPVEPPPLPDAVVEARIAVKNAWEANHGSFVQPAVEKAFATWSNGEVLMDATAERLLTYAEHLTKEAGA